VRANMVGHLSHGQHLAQALDLGVVDAIVLTV
jgi:hypothetical protein